jgi:hypothetical protein
MMPGRGGEDFLRPAAGDFRGQFAHPQRVAFALLAGAGVGIACIDDDAAEFAGLHVRAADFHRRGEDRIGREDGGLPSRSRPRSAARCPAPCFDLIPAYTPLARNPAGDNKCNSATLRSPSRVQRAER